jgi:hypothetical protein
MSLDICKDCPANCFGNELSTDCVVYKGGSLTAHLDGDAAVSPIAPVVTDTTTDDVMSKSKVRNTSSICASNIINRTFQYTLTAGPTSTTFGWNLLDVISALPSGYNASVVRVRVSGSGSTNLIADSSNPSSGIGVRLDQYPITADFTLRVSSSCGDIDLLQTVKILSTTGNSGTYNAVFDAQDINPQSGEIVLTQQLDGIESQIVSLSQKLNTIPDATLPLADQQVQIDQLEEAIGSPSELLIEYTKNGASQLSTLTAIFNDIYIEIAEIKSVNSSQQIEIDNLRSQLDASNAS